MVKFDKNGQGYFDFDSLEMETSVNFVKDLKNHLETYNYKIVDVDRGKNTMEVYTVDPFGTTYKIWFFNKKTGYYFNSSFSKHNIINLIDKGVLNV